MHQCNKLVNIFGKFSSRVKMIFSKKIHVSPKNRNIYLNNLDFKITFNINNINNEKISKQNHSTE